MQDWELGIYGETHQYRLTGRDLWNGIPPNVHGLGDAGVQKRNSLYDGGKCHDAGIDAMKETGQ